jgi:hypothetical protein
MQVDVLSTPWRSAADFGKKEESMKSLSTAVSILVLLAILSLSPALLARDDGPCSYRSVSGAFGYAVNGTRNGVGPVAGAGILTFHRDGTVEGKQTVSFNGIIADETYSGTYTVESDCSGSFTVDVVSPIAPRTSHVNVIWTSDSNAAKSIFTDAGTVLTADAQRVSTGN